MAPPRWQPGSAALPAAKTLRWGAASALAFAGLALIKVWFWLELQKNAIVREVKRLEVQVGALQRSFVVPERALGLLVPSGRRREMDVLNDLLNWAWARHQNPLSWARQLLLHAFSPRVGQDPDANYSIWLRRDLFFAYRPIR